MCIAPVTLRHGPKSGAKVPCRNCWQCAENRVTDWVGRLIAERITSKAANAITLTYGKDEHGKSDHVRAAVLFYSDVQKYLKLLRRHGYPMRYFAVGEYGSLKGRSHWHLVIFWKDRVPPHEIRKRYWSEPHWPHGFSFWDHADESGIRYVCKYITKDVRAMERDGHLGMSKKPPLGAAFFAERARQYVEQGLAPQDAFYDLPGEGRMKRRYYLSGRSRDLFCEAFLRHWAARYPGACIPPSRFIAEYEDRIAKVDPLWVPTPKAPHFKPHGAGPVLYSRGRNAYFCEVDGRTMWWAYVGQEGERRWLSEREAALADPVIRREARVYRESSASSGPLGSI